MAMTVSEAEEMTTAAEGKPVLALIDHELRFQAGRQKAHEMLRDGVIGTVRHAKYNFRAPGRGDASMPWNWWSDLKQGGGALGAINSHIIDSFNWMLGTGIVSVSCQLHTHVKQRRDRAGDMRAVTTDDEANMLLRFVDGGLTTNATGLVCVSMVEGPEYVNRFEIFGTEGAMRIDNLGELYVAKTGEREWQQIKVDLGKPAEGSPDTGFSRGFKEFAPKIVDAVRSGSKTIEHAATFKDGLKVQRVLDAARESDSLGRVIAIH
jgi:predicted dehydrogenase